MTEVHKFFNKWNGRDDVWTRFGPMTPREAEIATRFADAAVAEIQREERKKLESYFKRGCRCRDDSAQICDACQSACAVLGLLADQRDTQPHASDCAYWSGEPCNCVTGKDATDLADTQRESEG